ncbi:MAG: restriction endonuclease [Chloroflexi bacterium AL-W]|nr:restriction endonuclease [Chloroflexi bacterium AL-N1]NOK71514.1 restriction endonuclease [Chloroflexi bacterium AL-N10]NOK78860.1 restriction endonuclease [Chloroflexi bacterium AL-N5]NOK86336.1 restriction endonuclease [Chloroflexi bacterium AL-W]NOK93305.1 restriction endonuclease [Chloroflexi bacterium AL-N15]
MFYGRYRQYLDRRELVSTQKDWFSFQEQICDHFISLGADAQTNVRIEGIRTCHDIDVFIKAKFLGQNMIWVIEAKHWKKRVNKSHVLALRTIVDDVGADCGFIVSTKGFQSGTRAINNL